MASVLVGSITQVFRFSYDGSEKLQLAHIDATNSYLAVDTISQRYAYLPKDPVMRHIPGSFHEIYRRQHSNNTVYIGYRETWHGQRNVKLLLSLVRKVL